MNSTEAKVSLLSYCRFAKQMHYVSTEVGVTGGCLADVLASNGTDLIEYEIKTSIQDLVKDSEKPKHIIYDPTPIVWEGLKGVKRNLLFEIRPSQQTWRANSKFNVFKIENGKESNLSGWHDLATEEEAKQYAEKKFGAKANTPNVLYYVIPELLWDKHKERIKSSLSDYYGIITFTGHNYHGMTVVKRAKKLHKNKVSAEMLKTIVARMSSEIAGLSMAHYMYVQNITELGKAISKEFDLAEIGED